MTSHSIVLTPLERAHRSLRALQEGAATALLTLGDQADGTVGDFLAAIHREAVRGMLASDEVVNESSEAHSIEGLSDGGLREKIARVIEPACPEVLDGLLAKSQPKFRERIIASWFGPEVLAKADAIIALSAAPERVGGGGMNSSSQSQPCAEKGPQPFSHDAPLSDGGGG